MIIKYFQIENLKTREFKLYLLYGKNEGLQKEIIDKYFIKGFTGEINKYEENEILQSSELIIEQILNSLPEGALCSRKPLKSAKLLKPPKGSHYKAIESPRGELGFFIVSDGSSMPYRMKIRAPSFGLIAFT